MKKTLNHYKDKDSAYALFGDRAVTQHPDALG